MKWNGYKGLKVAEDTSHASFKFSWMKDAKRRLSSKDPSDWDGLQWRLMTWQPRYAAFSDVAFRLRSTLVVFILTWTLGPNKGNTLHKLSSGQVQKTQVEQILPIHRIRKLRRAPETPRGPIALKDGFILVLFWIWPTAMKTWMIIYCNAVLSSAFQCKHLSNVTSMW